MLQLQSIVASEKTLPPQQSRSKSKFQMSQEQEKLEHKIELAFQQSRAYLEHLKQRNAVFLRQEQQQYQHQEPVTSVVPVESDNQKDIEQSSDTDSEQSKTGTHL